MKENKVIEAWYCEKCGFWCLDKDMKWCPLCRDDKPRKLKKIKLIRVDTIEKNCPFKPCCSKGCWKSLDVIDKSCKFDDWLKKLEDGKI